MTKKFVIGFDDSDSAKRALNFAVDRAKAQGASIVIAHVLEWSPYSFLTPEELEERHTRRKEELERANAAILDPVAKSLKDSGVNVETVLKYGHIAEMLCTIAEDNDANQIVIGRTGKSGLTSRFFGSVAGTLAQSAPVPVTIVP